MGVFNQFPWTDYHKFNLTFLLKKMKELIEEFTKLEKKTDDAIEYMKDNIEDSVTQIINNYIQEGLIDVAVEYTADTERLDIIVTNGGNE